MIVRMQLSLLLSVLACACGSNTTTGRLVTLETEVVADVALDEGFETQTGWTVNVSEAALSLGALYYFDGEPAFVRREAPSLWRQLAALIGPSVAHAHPGHYVAGMARGQMLEPAVATLATTPSPLAAGEGITGPLRSGSVVFAASDRTEPALQGAVAYVRGSAEKAGKTVHFVLSASFDDVARNASEGEVRGCVFDETVLSGEGTVTLTVKPQVWLNLVHFDALEEGSSDEPTQVAVGADAQIAFVVGVVQLSAYHFTYRAER